MLESSRKTVKVNEREAESFEREQAIKSMQRAITRYLEQTAEANVTTNVRRKSNPTARRSRKSKLAVAYSALSGIYGACVDYYCGWEESDSDLDKGDNRPLDMPKDYWSAQKLIAEAAKRAGTEDRKLGRWLISGWAKVVDELFERKVYPRDFHRQLIDEGGIEAFRVPSKTKLH